MSVYTVIQCDICANRYEEPGTNQGFVLHDAIKNDGWQKVTYEMQRTDPETLIDRPLSITEVRCPSCTLHPENRSGNNAFL